MKKYLGGGDVKQVRSIAGKHESKMHKGAKKMKAGGPTSTDCKTMGRNVSRANNQRGR